VNANIAGNHSLYIDATYDKGNHFDHTQGNIGYRYSF
jgi:outer membrane autotransporter protein